MKAEQVLEHIKQIWAADPLPVNTAPLAPMTVDGIQKQLDAGSKMILFMAMENGNKVIKTIKVEQ